LEETQGTHASDEHTNPNPEVDTSLRSSASASRRRVRLYRDSKGWLVAQDIRRLIPAIMADAAADFEYGRPLDYRDPTGEIATFNVLVTSPARRRP